MSAHPLLQLAEARDALSRFKAAGPDPRAVFRQTPGCSIGCGQCDIKCAILTGEVHDLEVKASALGGASSFFISEPGGA